MMKRYLLLGAIFLLGWQAKAQELNVTVKINIQKLQTVDPKVFETLEQTVNEFLNSQKWTEDIFEPEERINCNFLLTIQEELSPTSFKADLAIQSSRPVFGSSYESPLLNHIDKELTFSYEQFQPVQFSRNTFNDNLSAVLSFYVYVILGMDYDSFSPFGGETYYQIAQEILNTVPQAVANSAGGWRSIDGNRNRFWMIENILSPRVRPYRQAMYDYHRQALDTMVDDIPTARAILVQAVDNIGKVNQSYPNSMIVQMFANTKTQELVEIFKKGTRQEQDQVIRVMTRLDPSGVSKYRAMR